MGRTNRKASALAALTAAVLLPLTLTAGCGSSDDTPADATDRADVSDQITGRQWHAVGIYTSPEAPSRIPDNIAEQPTLVLGAGTAVGSTGCSRYSARVSYFTSAKEDSKPESANAEDADLMRVDSIKFAEPAGQSPNHECAGPAAWADKAMRNLFQAGHDFSIGLDPNGELVLRLADGEVDSPALRFAGL